VARDQHAVPVGQASLIDAQPRLASFASGRSPSQADLKRALGVAVQNSHCQGRINKAYFGGILIPPSTRTTSAFM
jgi:hypothetical protein